jgi:hypothetical protein
MLSSLSILLACTAHGDAWVDGMFLITVKMTTSKVDQQILVGIATRLRLDDPRIESWWGARSSAAIKTTPGGHTVQRIPGLFHGGKMAKAWS